jgi:hypothetical protein
MSDTPRMQAAVERATDMIYRGFDSSDVLAEIIQEARIIERELNAADKIIADAKQHVEEFKDMYPDEQLWEILNRKEIKRDEKSRQG